MSGHASGKSIRTVKTSVGSGHYRFGTQRAMELGVKLEQMLFGMWSPHKGGPLSHGVVYSRTVSCPLHSWKLQLESGEAVVPDVGCSKTFDVMMENGQVYLAL